MENINDAQSSLSVQNCADTRFALQQSLVELDKIIGEEILKLLPTQILQGNHDDNDDNVSGSMLGYSGVYAHRSYSAEGFYSNIEIITNSPFLCMEFISYQPVDAGNAGK